ncbi:MAG: hypothetical protein K2X81_11325, partial [Candidatus Obscuribacterales bacterium]|nr:hypothetical protein [Candidatus Obscuribacterales bacterium]
MIGGQLAPNGLITGGVPMNITQGMLLTPAENAALYQSVNAGQHLMINNLGAAVAGSANINSSWASNLSTLVVPSNVSLNTIGFNTSSPLNVAGASAVLGSVNVLQNSAGQTAALNFGNNLN